MKPWEPDAAIAVPPVPPALSWEEIEAGADGQLPLPGVVDRPTIGERVFLSLARSWARQFDEVPENRPPSRQVDELALCALSIAHDYGPQFTIVAQSQIAANIGLTHQRGSSGWLDRVPWSLTQMCTSQPSEDCWQMQGLIANLNHHNSAIRMWMMEIAWVIRSRLPQEKALPILLENVASTLAGVDMAWGLASALFEDQTAFHNMAAAWLPQNHFDKQYVGRAEHLKDQTSACQAGLWKLEANLFRRIIGFSLGTAYGEGLTPTDGISQ
jgi:hypothetical protein